MYQLIPSFFFIPVRYSQEDILNGEKITIIEKGNFHNDFINKITIRKDLVIGISLPTQREEKWVREKEHMEKYAKSKGVIVKIENADTDTEKQASQVDKLLLEGIDVLILAPVDSVAAATMVEKAHNVGIKVIAYDRLIKNSDVDLLVNFNNLRIGELQGRYITMIAPKGNYIIMSGDPEDDNSKYIKEGAMEYIRPLVYRRDIKIVTDEPVINWEPNNAYKIVKDSLAANKNKIDAIVAPNDATAGAAIEALKEQDLAGKIPVTGMDGDLAAIQRIVQGTQSMTVLKDTRELSKTAIDAAIKLAKAEGIDTNGEVYNGKIDVPAILLTPIIIDKNNIDSAIIGSGYLKEEDVYKR